MHDILARSKGRSDLGLVSRFPLASNGQVNNLRGSSGTMVVGVASATSAWAPRLNGVTRTIQDGIGGETGWAAADSVLGMGIKV